MEKHFQIATLYLTDCQRLIAAYKALRWDVVKWAVAINVGLAAASLSYMSLRARLVLWLLSNRGRTRRMVSCPTLYKETSEDARHGYQYR